MSRKAMNLVTLEKHGVRVPRGFTLEDTHYRAAVHPVLTELIEAGANSGPAQQVFSDLEIPQATASAIQHGLARLGPSKRFAVRSSGNIFARGRSVAEDGGDVSLAGQFESFLNVPGHLVVDAVRQCWASLFNRRSMELFSVNEEYVYNSAMTVLVQEMVTASASAVVMTVDPLGDGTTGGIELAVGPCEAIVGGAITPDEISFDRSDGTIVERRIGSKEYALEYGNFARGSENAHMKLLPSAVREQLAVSERVLIDIVDTARRIERIFGVPQDVELVVGEFERITVVQARSIIRLPSHFIPFGVPTQLPTNH